MDTPPLLLSRGRQTCFDCSMGGLSFPSYRLSLFYSTGIARGCLFSTKQKSRNRRGYRIFGSCWADLNRQPQTACSIVFIRAFSRAGHDAGTALLQLIKRQRHNIKHDRADGRSVRIFIMMPHSCLRAAIFIQVCHSCVSSGVKAIFVI